MRIETDKLISELTERTRKNIDRVKNLNELSDAELKKKKDRESWNALECIEHLNLYGDFYIPEIRRGIEGSNTKPEEYFKSGIFGGFFAKSMLPGGKMPKVKTFKDKNPNWDNVGRDTIAKFLTQQGEILDLLEKASEVDLNKIKVPLSISKWIKLKLGDAFRVVIYHNQRHIEQAERASKS